MIRLESDGGDDGDDGSCFIQESVPQREDPTSHRAFWALFRLLLLLFLLLVLVLADVSDAKKASSRSIVWSRERRGTMLIILDRDYMGSWLRYAISVCMYTRKSIIG